MISNFRNRWLSMQNIYIVFDNLGYSNYPHELATDQLIPFLSQYIPCNLTENKLKNFTIYYATNVISITEYYQRGFFESFKNLRLNAIDTNKRAYKVELTNAEKKKLFNKAKHYYYQLIATEQFPGQTEAKAFAGQLSRNLPVKIIYKPNSKLFRTPKPHTTQRMGKNSANLRPMRVFARDNKLSIIQRKTLRQNEIPIRHINRSYRKHHLEDLPQFDDFEYTTARHSTGWKYSTKKRHQWEIHLK